MIIIITGNTANKMARQFLHILIISTKIIEPRSWKFYSNILIYCRSRLKSNFQNIILVCSCCHKFFNSKNRSLKKTKWGIKIIFSWILIISISLLCLNIIIFMMTIVNRGWTIISKSCYFIIKWMLDAKSNIFKSST